MTPAILLASLALATPLAAGAPPPVEVDETALRAAPSEDTPSAADPKVTLRLEEALQRALVPAVRGSEGLPEGDRMSRSFTRFWARRPLSEPARA